jgi:MFS family permease
MLSACGAAGMLKSKVANDERRVPALIRRNTFLLAATQAFVGIGQQMVPTLGAIMVIRLLGSATFAGLATSLLNFSRFLVAYPIGWVADTLGRRAALMIGLTLSLVGALGVGISVIWTSFPLFVLGILVFGLGVGAGQQLRLAAADLYPPTRRAEGLGYVLTGSLAGAMGGPVIISFAQAAAPGISLDPIALAWLLVPIVLIPSMGLVLLVRPDPREIANNLRLYYPDENLEVATRAGAPTTNGARAWIRHYPLRVAFITSFAAQGTMTLMMALTPVAMSHHGHELPMISLAVALHVMGMYGLSLPLGHLSDRVGRRNVLLLGTLTTAFGASLVALTEEYLLMTVGVFLVGVGWSCVNVSASALIADLVPPNDRGRAIGTNDTFSGAGAIMMPLAGGLLVELAGLPSLAVVGTGLMLIPFLMLLRLKESSPGHFK